MSYYIYDIDGTLANTGHRTKFVRVAPGEKKNWKEFFNKERMLADSPIEATVRVAQLMQMHSGVDPIYCTGRPSEYRQVTVEWLMKHVEPGVPALEISSRLYMRAFNDHRDDTITKTELFQEIVKRYGPPLAMFEDRDRVVKSIRDLGYRVFQVDDGNF